MKQIYLLLATLLLVHVQVFGQLVPSYVPINGLVGWWGFNGNAQDGSGNGNHGTVNGATLTTDRFGNQNGAYYFDGVNDYIQLPFGLQNQPISVSVWFKTNIIGSQSIVDNDIAHLWGNNIILDYQANNRICLLFHDGHVVSNYAYSTNQNYHVIAIWENTSCKLYVNGVLIDNFLHSQGVNEGGLYRFGVGSSNAFWFNGTLDDIGIWNRALTPQEITNLYIAQPCQVSITTQPSNQTTGTNRNVQFSVVSSDSNSNYRWQTDMGLGFQNLTNAGQFSGVNTSTLNVSNTSHQNDNHLFRCIVSTTNCGSDTSDVVTLNVNSSATSTGVPNKFTYQSVVRDTMGQLVTNQQVGMRLSLQRGPHLANLYTETHQLTTNSNGLLTCIIGSGQPTLGVMDTIDWSGGMVYVKTEIDMTGGSNYSLVSMRELLSVPYALYSLNSGSSTPGPVGPMGPQGPAGNDGAVGPQGPAGNDGPQGVPGPQGPAGNDGAVGPQGLQGVQGNDGPQGVPGPQGPQGLQGNDGPQGVPGPQGPQGSFPSGTQPGEMNYWNGTAWVSVAPGINGQVLTFCNGVPSWNGCFPSVVTTPVSNITLNSVITGGNVTSDGGSMVSARGVVYDTSSNPNLSNNFTTDGTGTASFTSVLSGLSSVTTYYVRAYATNGVGTSYGNELSFMTNSLPGLRCPGTPTVTDIDGNIYNTVQIGNQCWTQSNLKVSKYRNGDSIPTGLNNNDWQNTTSGAYAIYNNDAVNDALYGKLYNNYAVTDIRGLCPTGWHVPTDSGWHVLVKYLDPNADTACRGCAQSPIAGGALKSTVMQPTPGGWNSPNTGATNSSGFTALPGGLRYFHGDFGNMTYYGCWSSSSVSSASDAYGRGLGYYGSNFYENHDSRTFGFSVRCLKD